MSSIVVASTDALAYVAAWLLVFVVICTAARAVYTEVTGETPEESWAEIVLGVSVIVAVLFALIRHRASRIARLLVSGERSKAVVEAFRAPNQWAWLTVSYERHGRAMSRQVLLASSRRTRALDGLSEVTIATDPAAPKRLVVVDLYEV